jgi:hypothetical protein
MRALTCEIAEDRPRYELREAGVVRGALEIAREAARVSTDDGSWDLLVYRRRGFWYAVALAPGAAGADAAYYPGWLAGGTIATADERYRLAISPLARRWRLRDEQHVTVAEFAVRSNWGRRARGTGAQVVRIPDLAPALPRIWLVLLFAMWVVLMEPEGVVTG